MLLFVIILILLSDFFIQISITNPERKKRYILIFSGIPLFLYAALRGSSVGTDTLRYINSYLINTNYKLSAMLSMIGELKDPGYQILSRVFGIVFPNPQWWLAFVAGIYIISVFSLIKNYSPYPIISVLAFVALGYFSFSLTGLRQTVAMSIILSSFKLIEDGKLLKFVLLVLFASLFHVSAIVFLILYPISKTRVGYKHLIVFLIATVTLLAFQSIVRILIGILFGNNRLAGYADRTTSLTASGFIIQLLIFIFCIYYYYTTEYRNSRINMLVNCSFIGLCFQMFATMIAEMFRVSMYFSIANIVLIPISLANEENPQVKKVELFGVLVVLIGYIFRDGIPAYSFFWN